MGLVALESTVLAHGLPFPENVQFAQDVETSIRQEGAVPATVGIVAGTPKVGLTSSEIERLATGAQVRKVSLRDLPVVVAQKADGATTVASTMWLAHRAGIAVFATGGIGGVHRGTGPLGTGSFDVSADLEALAAIPMVVVCAGPKSVLDLPATRELLETKGVTVVGYGTDEMPAFYSRSSGLAVDVRCETPEDVVALVKAQRALALQQALVVMVPIPEAAEIPQALLDPALAKAHEEAMAQGLRAAEVTPFLLRRLRTLTDGKALEANLVLLKNNAQVAAQIAVALAR